MRIGIDMGHTLSGAGTGASGYKSETTQNRLVGNRLIAMLEEGGHTVYNCTVDKSTNDLADRVALANKQKLDLFVSLHLNAVADSRANGVETYSYNTSGQSYTYSKAIQAELVKSIGWYDRKCKTANFAVLRNTKAPAVLVELGFCTNKGDMDKWNTEKISAALFKGITGKAYVKPAPPANDTMYRVVVGWFKDRGLADKRVAELKAKGIASFLVAHVSNGVNGFRVVAGTYNNKANAEAQVAKLKALGFDSFLVAV